MSVAASYTIPDPTPPAASTEAAPVGSGDVTASDHCPEGLSLLISQWKDKPRIAALLCAWLGRLQSAEDTVIAMIPGLRGVEDAEGVQLDLIGRVVLEGRRSKTDDRYRDALRVRILANRSNGHPEELIEIVAKIDRYAETSDRVVYRELPPASAVLEGRRPILNDPREIARFLASGKPAGVRIDYVYSEAADADTFELASGSPEGSTAQGWGSTTESTGGDLAGVVVA